MKEYGKQRGSETILLVEDEHLVREVTQRILERSGYIVLTASNGKEALDVYTRKKEKISLVILDLIMPEMGGRQCLEELREIHPNVKILISSGYPVNEVEKKVIESGARGFVYKPYTIKKMLAAVRDTLDAD